MGQDQSTARTMNDAYQRDAIGGLYFNLCCDCLGGGSFNPGMLTCCLPPGLQPPSGPEWDQAVRAGAIHSLLREAQNIARAAPTNCCNGYQAYNIKSALEDQWLPIAATTLAPFSLYVNVHIYITRDDKGNPHEHLVIIFHKAQAVLVLTQLPPQHYQQPVYLPQAQQPVYQPQAMLPVQNAMPSEGGGAGSFYPTPTAPPAKVL